MVTQFDLAIFAGSILVTVVSQYLQRADTNTDADQRPAAEGDTEPTIEELRERYAQGEITYAHFESRLADVVDDEREAVRVELIEKCNGVGPQTADAVLDHFDVRTRAGLVGVIRARSAALTDVPGVGPDTAQAIEQQFS